jgi:hypothetical protein
MVERAHTHIHNVLTVGTVYTKILASKIKQESYWVCPWDVYLIS